jgi:hypothetical protein
MDQVLNSSFPRFSRQAGRGVHVDSLKRVPSALHVQAHRVYDAIASLHRLCELSLVVDIGSDRVQSSRTGRECSPFRVPRRRADLAIMCEKVAHDASAEEPGPAEYCHQPSRSSCCRDRIFRHGCSWALFQRLGRKALKRMVY